MKDQVEEVKSKVDIVALIGEYFPLQKAGRNYRSTCPFHSEKTPSFMVSPELQIFKCFGCHEGGDVFSFLQKHENMDFPEALQFLADRVGVKLTTRSTENRSAKDELVRINNLAAQFYHWVLTKHPSGKGALEYLLSERDINRHTIKTFELGFAPSSGRVLSNYLTTKKSLSPDLLEKAGLVFRGREGLRDRFAGRIIFPLKDHRGKSVGLAGRVLPSSNVKMAKYINSPETLVYHKSQTLYGMHAARDFIKEKRSAHIVEGEVDFLSSWQAGVKNIVAIKGTAMTQEQAQILSRFADEVVFALDTDFAGDKAARRGVEIAQSAGLAVKVALMGDYKDPDEFVRADRAGFRNALREAVDVWEFVIDSIISTHGAGSAQGKAKISAEAVPILISIADKIVQSHYVGYLAQKIGVEQTAIYDQMKQVGEDKQGRQPIVKNVFTAEEKKERTRREILEERFLTLSLQMDAGLIDSQVKGYIKTPFAKRLLEAFFENESKGKFDKKVFAKGLPAELRQGFADMMLEDIGSIAVDKIREEAQELLLQLAIVDTKEKLTQKAKQIAILEKKKGKTGLQVAKERFASLSQKLSRLEETGFPGIIQG